MGKKTILVVEDDPSVRTLIVQSLRKDFVVLEAEDGLAALDLLARTWPPDLIVADVAMPRLDGVAFVRALKQAPEYKHVPVLFLTARDGVMDVVEGINAGVRAYVTKPFKLEKLRDRILRITGPSV